MLTRLALFPETTQILDNPRGGRLAIGGCDLGELAARYGSPLYIYDAATIAAAIGAYRGALEAYYPGPSGLTYAGKAYLSVHLAAWMAAQGLRLDCSSAGEIAIARRAGAARQSLLAHGVNKSDADLEAAAAYAGVIVVDNLDEAARLAALLAGWEDPPQLWLRYRPGLETATHASLQTGGAEAKFGMSRAELPGAAQLLLAAGLAVSGVHFHLGSHFGSHFGSPHDDFAPMRVAIEESIALIAALGGGAGWSLCPGGGLGAPYHEDDLPGPSIPTTVRSLAQAALAACRAQGLPLPALHLEPGRSLVARAGVAVYRVGAVKRAAGRRWLLVDGGLADNPRPALYGARYSALPVLQPERPAAGAAWVGGPYCESGDVLLKDLPLPEMAVGELLAVPVSGAYQLSMSSNYNGALRPAVVWIEGGQAQCIQARETLEELICRAAFPAAG
ncbi:MAG: diaminopimelate decarboxylase [Chloroflexi bacterium]|nr:diaminopimelate decarboxylase [Chloroflexota bacterium]